jgi:acetyl-CoA C-acetyltransferase
MERALSGGSPGNGSRTAPCIIGAAQRTWHPGPDPAPEPLLMWQEVARAAAEDTGASPAEVLGRAASLDVLYCQSWPYDDPAGRLASALGVSPARQVYSGIGGTTPHLLVAQAAAAIAAGQLDVALVVSGEALDSVRRAKKAGDRLAWSHRDPEKKPFPFEEPFHPAEIAHSVFQAWLTFAVFDVARRAHLRVDPDGYRRALGDLLAPLSDVAASNPYAWFPSSRSAGELIEPTPSNRMVGYPYTKTMVSVMDVDMAAAVLIAGDEAADGLGISPDRRVYLHGTGYALDPVYVAEHEPMWASPAMSSASESVLSLAGIGVDDISFFDLYSCFGSSLNFACDALGLQPDDSRGLTVTGGLPFAGGPGSGYMLHSTAAMVEKLRDAPGAYGMVSGVGMHMTKHAFGVYRSAPPSENVVAALAAGQGGASHGVAPGPGRAIQDVYAGDATVAAYSVVHSKSGEPEWGLAVCDLPDGKRAYARIEDQAVLTDMEKDEWVGAEVRLGTGNDRVNMIIDRKEPRGGRA